MKVKTIFALFCAAFSFLFVQAQARPPRRPVTTLPAAFEYGLVFLALPDTSQPGRRDWRWVLEKTGSPSPHKSGRLPQTEVEVTSLDAPPLMAYIRHIPAGKSIQLLWQFQMSDLDRQAGLTSLQRLCTSRKIGFQAVNWASSYAETENVK